MKRTISRSLRFLEVVAEAKAAEVEPAFRSIVYRPIVPEALGEVYSHPRPCLKLARNQTYHRPTLIGGGKYNISGESGLLCNFVLSRASGGHIFVELLVKLKRAEGKRRRITSLDGWPIEQCGMRGTSSIVHAKVYNDTT